MITAKFVSKRGDTGQGKRRKPSQPHSKNNINKITDSREGFSDYGKSLFPCLHSRHLPA